MSYINEALKKAQREKDAISAKYSGFLAARREKKKPLSSRALWWIPSIVVVIFLAFALYSWLDPGPETTSAIKRDIPQGASRQRAVLDAQDIYARAQRFQKAGRSTEARNLYRTVISIDPNHVSALNNIGVTFLQEKNFINARKSFEDAMRLHPNYVDPYYNLACLYAIQGDTKKGLDYLRKAVVLNSTVRQWARNDGDLRRLKALPEFQEIIRVR
ncbi:MAG: TPR end-of-group domain-containing protein [Thermodesulfobacteriota bacterium]